jgi:hypothetical protein
MRAAVSNTDNLVSDIDGVLDHLASTVDELVDRLHPKSLAASGVDSVKSRFVDETGSVRFETILPVAGAAVAVVALGVVFRRILR